MLRCRLRSSRGTVAATIGSGLLADKTGCLSVGRRHSLLRLINETPPRTLHLVVGNKHTCCGGSCVSSAILRSYCNDVLPTIQVRPAPRGLQRDEEGIAAPRLKMYWSGGVQLPVFVRDCVGGSAGIYSRSTGFIVRDPPHDGDGNHRAVRRPQEPGAGGYGNARRGDVCHNRELEPIKAENAAYRSEKIPSFGVLFKTAGTKPGTPIEHPEGIIHRIIR